jgi:PKD repeat protein
MFQLISKFASTDIVFADSHGPYVVDGGSPITLSAGAANPNATYTWDLGDGTTASTATVTHVYGNDGQYVAQVTVTVNEPGGVTSHHYGLITVRNIPPIVNAGPNKTVNEGDIVSFSGSFSDAQWLETHTATWDWGDSSKIDDGVVSETHNPPAGQGTVTGSHAWCDSGTYTVTLSVQDKGGAIGRSRTTVTVLNMPPVVCAVAPTFAYPCSVLTLAAKFSDPGWCDSHAAFWDFGDCTGPQRAVVYEKHDPPAGEGVAIASHTYNRCGTYYATCTVSDDDGATGTASTKVQVVDILNAGFEEGYCSRNLGVVGNHWEPYVALLPTLAAIGQVFTTADVSAGSDIFQAEEYCVHCGERSQRIRFVGKYRAGLLQQVGANKGWDYQITAWYSLNEQSGGVSQLLKDIDDPAQLISANLTGGMARLGIDPTGGNDPSSPSIVWAEGYIRPEWAQLCVRAAAAGNAITIYLEAQSAGRLGVDASFDDAGLLAVQPFCPTQDHDTCVDFSDLKPDTSLPPIYTKDGFTFVALDQQSQLISAAGPPIGQNKLRVHPRGLEIDLPFVADAVRITIVEQLAIAVVVSAYDTNNQLVGQASTSPSGTVQTVQMTAKGIVKVRVIAKEGGSVIKVCAHPESQATQPKL